METMREKVTGLEELEERKEKFDHACLTSISERLFETLPVLDP
jgi:hypothetical protein